MAWKSGEERKSAKKYGAELITAIHKYCAYQERSHDEARNKLYELGATRDEVEHIIADLISDNILNEERFARSFARGKWRIKKWGKIKIIHSLKALRVSEYCIKKAMTEIDGEEYYNVLLRLTDKKWDELRTERLTATRKSKTYRYLAGRGYESSLITEAIAEITADKQ
jgi:regulatory protein